MRATIDRQISYWLAVLVLCSAFTWLEAVTASAHTVSSRPVLVPLVVAFGWQLPLVVMLAALLGSAEGTLARLSPRWSVLVGTLLVAGCTVAGVTFYVSSQVVHGQLDAFVDFAAFRTAASDTRQMLQYAWHDAPAALLAACALFVAAPAGYLIAAQRPHSLPGRAAAHGARFAAWITVFALSASIGSAALGPETRRAAWYHTYPTVYAARAAYDAAADTRAEAAAGEFGRPLVALEAWAAANPLAGRRPDVFLIVLESVGADHLGFNGYARPDVTPNLDRLATESLAFVTAYAPSNHSNYAQTSILSAQYPRRTRALDYYEEIDYPKVLLFDVLSAYGYETAIISSQDESWQGMRRFYTTGSHVDHFLDATEVDRSHRAGISAHDYRTRERAEEFLLERDRTRPVFIYMNFQATHFDYRIPKDAPRPYQPDTIDFPFAFWRYPKHKVDVVLNRYDNALRYVDSQLGRFLAFLRKEGLYDDAIVVVASDHSEAFYRQGFPTHGSSLFDDQVRTFFTLKAPGSRATGLRVDAVSLIDVAPTILDAMQLPSHPNFQGRSVLEPTTDVRDIFITSQGVAPMDAVVRFPWKLIRRRAASTQLVNVEGEPSEKRDLSTEHPRVAEALRATLERFIATQMSYYAQEQKETYPPRW